LIIWLLYAYFLNKRTKNCALFYLLFIVWNKNLPVEIAVGNPGHWSFCSGHSTATLTTAATGLKHKEIAIGNPGHWSFCSGHSTATLTTTASGMKHKEIVIENLGLWSFCSEHSAIALTITTTGLKQEGIVAVLAV
jgi:hypothetical protein